MIAEIRTAIKNKLDTLKWTGKPLVNVFDYFPINLAWYPSVMFEPAWLENSYMTTWDNYRTYKFKLVILQEFSTITRQRAIEILVNAFDQVVYEFDKDYTLWWVIDKLDAVPGDFGSFQFESWLAVFFEILLSCSVLKPINTL